MNKNASTSSAVAEPNKTSTNNSTGSAHAMPVNFEEKQEVSEWSLPIPKDYIYALSGAIAEGHYTEF